MPTLESIWNTDRIIEHISEQRVTSIKSLLKPDALATYLEDKFEVFAISAVRTEFLKRDLTSLAESPLDLVHYATTIKQAKELALEPEANMTQEFIDAEVRLVIQKYLA
ncbi:MAG: hypothetical protein J0L67_04365 [Cytophagales bacterium]|nr:hypothetical protein [Cytophagales bacterium]